MPADRLRLSNRCSKYISSQSCVHRLTAMYAAVEALRHCDENIEHMRDEYDQRRRFMLTRLRGMGLKCFEPFGAFYIFPNIAEFGMTSEEFAMRFLKEYKVAIVPGTASESAVRDS